MAIIHHYTRDDSGEFVHSVSTLHATPADFCVSCIPPGTPFRVYAGRDAGRDITTDIDAMCEDGEFTVVEGAGGVAAMIISAVAAILISPMLVKVPTVPDAPQAESPNNSLTQRTNKPRPYERVYDVCGTVQTIPSDLMTPVIKFENGVEIEYGYYYLGRGALHVEPDGVTDGDSRLMDIFGSSAKFYGPNTTPNGGAPFLTIGDDFAEPLYIATRSNEVDGITLLAPNEVEIEIGTNQITLAGVIATISAEDADFSRIVQGSSAVLSEAKSGIYTLDGTYPVTAVTENSVSLNVSSNMETWGALPQGASMDTKSLISPSGGFVTSWFTISKIKPDSIYMNLVAPSGLYGTGTNGKDYYVSVDCEIEHQLLDDNLQPIGPIVKTAQRITDREHDQVGVTVKIDLGAASYCRMRARRVSDKYYGENFQSEEVKLRDLYGIKVDSSSDYGDITTVHTKRRRTISALQVREPQLKVLVTELLYPYLGGGVFGAELVPNTQAVQSLIRLMRDPVVGGLTLSAANMDALIATQAEIETYFGSAEAGQFCYTFDDQKTTTQDIIETIAGAIFCTSYREGLDIKLQFERPQPAPAMLFTHRSKIGKETWERSFNTRDSYDSVEFTWIDPDTNIRETITIPEEGGAKPHKIESKGVRNYRQAYWLAHRARQKDALRRVSVDFTATEEGIYVKPGRTIGVVKGSRVGTADGYVVAQNGLVLTLSQEVDFVAGDTHSILLKRRDGSVESVSCEQGANKRTVQLLSLPSEPIYTGNSALKTEFSFGNDARHMAQTIVPATVEPSDARSVKITGYNYDSGFYLFDGVSPFGRQFSDEFTGEFA